MSKRRYAASKRISRADLLRALGEGEEGQLLDTAAQLAGFKPPPKPQISLKLPPLPGSDKSPGKKAHSGQQPQTTNQPDNQPHYYRVIERKPSEILPEPGAGKGRQKPEWLDNPETLDPDSITPLPIMPPEKEPLVPWAKLWPVLRSLLSEQAQTRQPDMPKIVRTVANGHWLERIPRRRRQRWSSHVQLLVDRPERTCLFNRDYSRLLEQLRQLRGTTGLELQRWQRQPGGRVRVERGRDYGVRDWQVPVSGIRLFILSDLGLLDDSGMATRAWVRVGQQLRQAGCQATVLLPLPERYLRAELVMLFDCISWHRSSVLQPARHILPALENTAFALAKDQHQAEDLLAWLSPAVRVEAALLRAVRHQLPAQDYDSGHEAAAWHHEEVERSRIGFNFLPQPAVIEKYRQRFKTLQAADPERAKNIAVLILRYHQHVFPTQRYEEILLLAELMGEDCPVAPAQVAEARAHMRQLVKAGLDQANELAAIRPFLMHLIERQHENVVRENDFYQVIWGAKRSEQGELQGELPEGFDPKNVLALTELPQDEPRDYVLFQEGLQALKLGTRERFERGDNDGWTTGTELAAFKTTSTLILKQLQTAEGVSRNQLINLDDEQTIALPLEEKVVQQVHVAGEELTIERIVKPEWAVMIGYEDQGQLYAKTQSNKGEIYQWYWHSPIRITRETWFESILPKKSEPKLKSRKINGTRGVWFGFSRWSKWFPAWAKECYYDEYGIIAEVEIFGVNQNFRWIEPTTFLMGSPEDEEGRDDDEILHQVTLSQGYWLADTACTQQLWQAVMGENPSRFKGENRPVENVSWDDIQTFLQQINKQHPALKLRLPSEAEWENACRAGTETAFHFGGKDDLSLERVQVFREVGGFQYRWQDPTRQKLSTQLMGFVRNAWQCFRVVQ
ncbi:MAG: SUMF1/EgtB/PvdO family nonheme iron enzyme [Thiolinea sp.]